jgi:hypothetical protein
MREKGESEGFRDRQQDGKSGGERCTEKEGYCFYFTW